MRVANTVELKNKTNQILKLYVVRPNWTDSSRLSLRSDAGLGLGC